MPKKHRNVNSWATKAVRRTRTPLQVINAKVDAWKKGKNVVLTIPNSNPHETNKPFIRRKAVEIWGRYSGGFTMKSDGK